MAGIDKFYGTREHLFFVGVILCLSRDRSC